MNRVIRKFGGKRALVAVAFSVLVSACMSAAVTPDDRFYRLPDLHGENAVQIAGLATTLRIGHMRADGVYHERSILYVDGARPLELRRYHYRYWSQAPAELVQQYFQDYLRDVTPRSASETGQGDLHPDPHPGDSVDGRILRFERTVYPDRITVTVRMQLHYRKSEPSNGASFVRVYEQSINMKDRTMQATVNAFGDALQQIFRSFLRDIVEQT